MGAPCFVIFAPARRFALIQINAETLRRRAGKARSASIGRDGGNALGDR
jgi:hypothetical protein